MAPPEQAKVGLVKGLGLFDATTIVMGSMIGSGIFIVSAEIAREVASPGLLILTWAIAAAMTLIAALSYGELASMMPRAGGQYVYLREAFGPLSGFLYGWTLFLVIQTGTIAAVAVAFAMQAKSTNRLGRRCGRFTPRTTSLEAVRAVVAVQNRHHHRMVGRVVAQWPLDQEMDGPSGASDCRCEASRDVGIVIPGFADYGRA
jgi:amino acid transporter